MTTTALDSPLLRMTQETPTQYWNDSCAVDELAYAVERGATGATSNPSIVLDVMKKEKAHWVPRVRELAAANPTWSEVELTWAIIEEMAARGAGVLQPVFERARRPRTAGSRSRRTPPTTATRPGWWSRRSASPPWPRTSRSSSRPPRRASSAIEEATFRGVNINATVELHGAPGDRRRRGRRARASTGARRPGGDVASMTPIVHDHDRPARRLDEGPRRAGRPRRPPGRRRTGPASPRSSGPTASSASAATGPACSRPPTATASTGPSSSAGTSA